jgi:tetratricopeptide (TPR) repeat protein
MVQDHVSRELLQQFFRLELSRRDAHEVIQHFMRRCEKCLESAVEVGGEEGYIYQEGDFQSALFPDDGRRYNSDFLRLLGSADDVTAELARERLYGIGLWRALEKHDQNRRLEMIQKDIRTHTWGLYDRLLEKCREMGFHAPAYAAEIAHLALAVVETLDPARYGVALIADFRARGLAVLGNAQRLGSDFTGAENVFRYAREALGRGTGDPFEEAHLLTLQASWHRDLGNFERAVELLDRATEIYRGLNDFHLEGRTLLSQSATLGFVHPEKGIELAQAGLALIDPRREPRLEWCGRHNLALFLNDAGKPREALAMLEASRPLYEQFNDPWTRTRLNWLEGKIARSLGYLGEAEETFKRLWFDLQQPVYAHELTLVSLDLVETYIALGKHKEALELIARFVPLLKGWGMHAEGLAMSLLMLWAIEKRQVWR